MGQGTHPIPAHTHTHSLSLSLSLSHTHSHTHTHSRHNHTHTHTRLDYEFDIWILLGQGAIAAQWAVVTTLDLNPELTNSNTPSFTHNLYTWNLLVHTRTFLFFFIIVGGRCLVGEVHCLSSPEILPPTAFAGASKWASHLAAAAGED